MKATSRENGFIEMVLHWQGGDHTALKLKMNTVGKHRWTVAEDTLTLVRGLARQMPDVGVEESRGCGALSRLTQISCHRLLVQ
jgi:hypothetical protein